MRIKLTDTQAEYIRRSPTRTKELATELGVSFVTVLNVRHGRTFKHLIKSVPLNRRYLIRTKLIRGENVSTAKLTEVQALAIKRSKVDARIEAKSYGVTFATIYNIRAGRTWSHLGD